MSALCHVWTAPGWQELSSRCSIHIDEAMIGNRAIKICSKTDKIQEIDSCRSCLEAITYQKVAIRPGSPFQRWTLVQIRLKDELSTIESRADRFRDNADDCEWQAASCNDRQAKKTFEEL
jgi:hypothetical protein